jgi:hypothetical protein
MPGGRRLIAAVVFCVAAAMGIVVWSGAASGTPALHTVNVEGTDCAGVGLVDATLRGSASDPRVAWIELAGYGDRDALFPKGFTVRFTPDLEVLNAQGNVVFRAGDKITGGCTGDGALLIGWP